VIFKLLGDLYLHKHNQIDLDAQLRINAAPDVPTLIHAAEETSNASRLSLMEAVGWYKKLLRLSPGCSEAWGDLAVAQEILNHNVDKSGRVPVDSLIQRGLEISPESANLWTLMGEYSVESSRQEFSFRRALQIERGHIAAWLGLARLYKGQSRDDLAKKALIQARIHDHVNPSVWEGRRS